MIPAVAGSTLLEQRRHSGGAGLKSGLQVGVNVGSALPDFQYLCFPGQITIGVGPLFFRPFSTEAPERWPRKRTVRESAAQHQRLWRFDDVEKHVPAE